MANPPHDLEEPDYAADELAEAEARKARSIAQLRSEGVPHIDWLPFLDPVSRAQLRLPDEVARRAFCLFAVAMRASPGMRGHAVKALRDYRVEGDLTPQERMWFRPFISERARVQASWRIEACVALLWYLGHLPELPRPDRVAETGCIAERVQDLGPTRFFTGVIPRTPTEALDEADLIYRYHWAVRDAQLHGRPCPAGLNGDVVMERHKALNWLIADPHEAQWDLVATDT